jgi:hypothetical protein
MEEQDQVQIRLPSDLYHPIVDHVHDNAQLAELCGVDRLFLELAREKLYAFVWVRPCTYTSFESYRPSHLLPMIGEPGADPKVGNHTSRAEVVVLTEFLPQFRLLFRTLNENPEIAEIVRKLGQYD